MQNNAGTGCKAKFIIKEEIPFQEERESEDYSLSLSLSLSTQMRDLI
jgi:hypothetical protein